LGQRIVKTSLAVFICLIIYYLRGYYGETMQTESIITAIICLQPYMRDTQEYSRNRMAGTLIGAGLGLLFLLLLMVFPILSRRPVILYGLMSLGVLISLYACVIVRMPDTASLAAIVFLCVVVTFPDIESPLRQAAIRLVDVFIGTSVAICINIFRFPRRKNRNRLFFIHAHDLVPDHVAHLSGTTLYQLNHLYDDGARICLMSHHAPAFFTLQMNQTKVNMPLIVMNGAAIYDVEKSDYLWKKTIPRENSAALLSYMDGLGISYFIYTIHKSRTCIFHHGPLSEDENQILDHMRHSQYRYYLDSDSYDPDEIVYIKIVYNSRMENPAIHAELDSIIMRNHMRAEHFRQVSAPNAYGVYIYSAEATIANAQQYLLRHLPNDGHRFEPIEISLDHGCQSPYDSIHLLHVVSRMYEPLAILPVPEHPHASQGEPDEHPEFH
ncbi:MAG: FUSC family protein, partial [Clostridia bacterium]|nr:FUSC family protein [Clostridia bacterium]